jgi:hypothetical protein
MEVLFGYREGLICMHAKRTMQPIGTPIGTGDLLYTLGLTWVYPRITSILYYLSGTAAAVLTRSIVDNSLVRPFIGQLESCGN